MKLETLPNIHLVRGNIVHSVLEDFFTMKNTDININNYREIIKMRIQELLAYHWKQKESELKKLDLTKQELKYYFEESIIMLLGWADTFISKLENKMQNMSIHEAFNKLRPKTEEHIESTQYGVQGVIDAIYEIEEEIHLIDYKTSNKSEISEEYRLQLAIYALLYSEKYGKLPSKVGIDFLKFGEKHIDVDEDLLNLAKLEIEMIHANTLSESIADYSKKTGPLCKWRTGQCDFYSICFPEQ